ncbi:MAG: hypothetical protein TREMPRED_001508 [Tremellales sp. Tagirdzhanova-0007]|nr:MAG: hypothetical protein TREMPRED_001508 [Tremellales sp. Tagirdzhanova-0007]
MWPYMNPYMYTAAGPLMSSYPYYGAGMYGAGMCGAGMYGGFGRYGYGMNYGLGGYSSGSWYNPYGYMTGTYCHDDGQMYMYTVFIREAINDNTSWTSSRVATA